MCCADEKLQQLGLDSATVREKLYAGTNSTKTGMDPAETIDTGKSSGSGNTSAVGSDYTEMQTHGYCPQETAAGHSAKQRCLQVLAGVWEPVLHLVQATPPASLVEHGVYTRPASSMRPECLGRGRVVIIGDAAHPMRPTGQGLVQTLEDAWGLGKAFKDACSSSSDNDNGVSSDGLAPGDRFNSTESNKALLQALEVFRQQRAKRVAPVIAFAAASGKASYYPPKDASDEEAATLAANGPGSDEMTVEQFNEYCFCVEFTRLSA